MLSRYLQYFSYTIAVIFVGGGTTAVPLQINDPTLPLNICIEYTSIWARIKLTTTMCMKHESPNMKCQVHGIKIVRSFHVKWLCFPFRRSQPQWFGEWQTIFNTSFWPIFTNVIMLQLGFSSNKNVDIKFSAHDAFLE